MCVWHKMLHEPVGDTQEFVTAVPVPAAAEEVVVAQSVLRDRDGIVLPADLATVIQLRNAERVVGASVISLFGERHVVLAEFAGVRTQILLGNFMPEREMALATQ